MSYTNYMQNKRKSKQFKKLIFEISAVVLVVAIAFSLKGCSEVSNNAQTINVECKSGISKGLECEK